jgi:signal transduction histidine kinase
MVNRFWDFLLHSIRGRLFLNAAAVVTSAILLALILLVAAHQHERALVERQLLETAGTLSLVVDRQLGQAEALLRGLSSSHALQREDFAAFHRRARAALEGSGHWVIVTVENGRQLMNTFLPFGNELPQSSPHREFEAVSSRNGTAVSNLQPSAVQAEPVVVVAVPFRGETGEVRFALGLVMQPASLSDILADQQLPPGWVASIVDGNGLIVARSRGADRFVGQPAPADLRAAFEVERQQVLETISLEGTLLLTAYHTSPTVGWRVVIGAPKSQLHASANRLLLLMFLMSFLIVGVGVAVSLWAGRGVVRSVNLLLAAAGAVGRGRLPDRVSTGLDETDQVADELRRSAEELVRREAELRQLNEKLEEAVQARTAELAQANKALSMRNQELQDFAHIASHDLQEPLRQIKAFAGIIQSDCADRLDDTGRSYLQRMEAAGARMSRLIKDILAFSRIASQANPLVPVDLNQALAAVLGDLELRLRDTEGKVEAETLPVVQADSSQMHQMLLNLVGNALKFHRPDVPPVVRVRAESSAEYHRIIVEDNGIGFEQKYAEQIFGPFQRLHGRGSFEGSGIGLAIVRRIAERHGGSVSATGRPGEGSCFEVTLPVVAAEDAP